jgi:hypothetical protein
VEIINTTNSLEKPKLRSSSGDTLFLYHNYSSGKTLLAV